MSEGNVMDKPFEPIVMNIGKDTEFAATITITPDNEECDWGGSIKFDNDTFNWPVSFDGEKIMYYEAWFYPVRKPSGAHMMGLLDSWHGEIVAFIKRMRGE